MPAHLTRMVSFNMCKEKGQGFYPETSMFLLKTRFRGELQEVLAPVHLARRKLLLARPPDTKQGWLVRGGLWGGV